MTPQEELEVILYHEIQKELNRELVKIITDPSHKTELTPMTYESEEVKKEYIEMCKKHDVEMQIKIKQLGLK